MNFDLIEQIASECFMPVAYGGAIESLSVAERVIACGIEKVVLNSSALTKPNLISLMAESLGSQAVVVAADCKRHQKDYYVFDHRSAKAVKPRIKVTSWLKMAEDLGAGELLVTSVTHEGTWRGADFELLELICHKRKVPLIYQGGLGNLSQVRDLQSFELSGVSLGNLVMFPRPGSGVLVHMPSSTSESFRGGK